MKLKLYFKKILEWGFWGQALVFTVFNIIVIAVCIFVLSLFEGSACHEFLQTLGLYFNSNNAFEQYGHLSGKEQVSAAKIIIELIGTILFSNVMTSVITNALLQKVKDVSEGHVHYKVKNHVVIIGYDTIVPSIVSTLIKDPNHASCNIMLQTSSDMRNVRNTLRTKITDDDFKRLILIHAPRQSSEELKLLYTVDAKEIFIVGDRSQDDHDAENMHTFEELVKIHSALPEKERPQIPLRVWFENEASFAALQLNDISATWRKYFDFRPYNFHKRWANKLLTTSSYGEGESTIVYPEFDRKGITADSDKHIHLIIIGMNRMGTALAKESAHLLHFPNFDEETGNNATEITFIDEKADVERDFFRGRHAGYFDAVKDEYLDFSDSETRIEDKSSNNDDKTKFIDVRFRFIKGRVESDKVRNWIREQMTDEKQIISIAICLSNPSKSLGMAMYLPMEVYTRGYKKEDGIQIEWQVEDEYKLVNIFVRQETTGSLIRSFHDAANSESANNCKYANLYPFGMIDESFALKYHSDLTAKAFNYIYSYYFAHANTLPAGIPQEEELDKYWKKLPISEQWSNLYLADSVEFKLRAIGMNEETVIGAVISEKDIDDLSRTEHNRWDMEKLMLGYRMISDKEDKLDNSKKKKLKKKMFAHSLIRPYSELHDDDKQLDKNIIVKLPDIMKMIKHIKDYE